MASLGIVFVTSVEALTALRFVQGFAASAGMVLSMAIVRDRFEGIQVGKALARLMLVVGVAPSIAPLIGAQFLLLGSWRYMFVALAVFGVMLLVLAFFLLKESLPVTAASFRRGRRGRPVLRFAAPRPDVHGSGAAERVLDGRAVHLRLVGDFRVPAGLRSLRAAVRLIFASGAVAITAGTQINGAMIGRVAPEQILRVGRARGVGRHRFDGRGHRARAGHLAADRAAGVEHAGDRHAAAGGAGASRWRPMRTGPAARPPCWAPCSSASARRSLRSPDCSRRVGAGDGRRDVRRNRGDGGLMFAVIPALRRSTTDPPGCLARSEELVVSERVA